jgi:hypothetical protein
MVEVLTAAFARRHLIQWNAFVKKIGEGTLVNRFDEVVEDLRKFAMLTAGRWPFSAQRDATG